jgi:hypothetical protein
VKTEKPTDWIKLPVNEKAVFENADWNQKNMLMMNAYLLPKCTLKNTHYVKSQMIKGDSQGEILLAALTTAGIVEFYKYDSESQKLDKLPLDLTELRKEKEIPKKLINTYEALTNIYNNVSFANIEWCPVHFENYKLLATITKSDEILIYNIHGDKAVLQNKINLDNASTNEMKWTYSNAHGHNLFVGMNNGNLMRFPLKVLEDGKMKPITENEEIFGKIKISPSNIHVDHLGNEIVIICCKNHSLEIFHKVGLKTKVISKHIGLRITGFDSIGHLQYIATTLSGNVHYIKLALSENRELEIEENLKLEISLPSDEIHNNSKMGFYGVTTSKNKVFVYLSSYPRMVSLILKVL